MKGALRFLLDEERFGAAAALGESAFAGKVLLLLTRACDGTVEDDDDDEVD